MRSRVAGHRASALRRAYQVTAATTVDGKVALVTGASRGIGRGIALPALAHAGAIVYITGRSALGETTRLAEGRPGRVIAAPSDHRDDAAVAAVFVSGCGNVSHGRAYTVRVIPLGERPARRQLQVIVDAFSALGAECKGALPAYKLVALDIPPTAFLAEIKSLLADGEAECRAVHGLAAHQLHNHVRGPAAVADTDDTDEGRIHSPGHAVVRDRALRRSRTWRRGLLVSFDASDRNRYVPGMCLAC